MEKNEAIKNKADIFLDKHARLLLQKIAFENYCERTEVTDKPEIMPNLIGLAENMERLARSGFPASQQSRTETVRGLEKGKQAIGFLIAATQDIISDDPDAVLDKAKTDLLAVQSDIIDIMGMLGQSRGRGYGK